MAQSIGVTLPDGTTALLFPDGTWKRHADAHLPAPTPVEQGAATRFRGAHWGSSPGEVMAREGEPEYRSDTLLTYTGALAGRHCEIIYIFAEGRLVRAKYLTTEINDGIVALDHFDELDRLLATKYGPSARATDALLADMYRHEPWKALELNEYSRFRTWETTETEITLAVYSEDYDISVGVEYSSIQLREFAQNARDTRDLDQL